ncbi:putative lactam utilization protein B-like protein [Thermanaerovibrio velox DSM 12556]|uniref:5-oxoprolinase subunit A n=1 Tax=Thermanaerovibrio velox DSM 12556 TaxID=926567 RepID=H0USC5_9BACT|nr:5-oxoprolinase subunit PxpA [Thermanaerovibrio velox]EHM10214.1 putative lactam utilization protein B-like protein [Thermanaerovibrio velox DSM 12556]
MSLQIDLNSDLGESFGAYKMGDDEALLKVVSSANVACGFHGGDPSVMRQTVGLCSNMAVAVGAHPSYQDLQGFGRRNVSMTPDEVYEICIYQVGALMGFCKAAGVPLEHVKPHGALYNQAAKDLDLAKAIAAAIKDLSKGDRDLILLGLANSKLQEAAEELSVPFAGEAFADRAYQPDGTLVPRSQKGAVIHDPAMASQRALEMALHGKVVAHDGSEVVINAQSICVHGDTRGAVEMAVKIREGLLTAGVRIRPIREVLGL